MAKWRPSRRQFYTLGIAASACTAAARVVTAVDVATNTVLVPGHGYSDADLIRFEVAAEGSVLPSPLSAFVPYEVVEPPSSDLFQVRTTGGAVLNIMDVGTGMFRVVEDFGPKLDAILDSMARWCDDHAIPYAPPFDELDPPASLVKCACELAAVKVALVLRVSSPGYSIDDIKAQADKAQVFLDKMRDGKPLAVPPKDTTPAVPELGAKAFSHKPPRGWKVDQV